MERLVNSFCFSLNPLDRRGGIFRRTNNNNITQGQDGAWLCLVSLLFRLMAYIRVRSWVTDEETMAISGCHLGTNSEKQKPNNKIIPKRIYTLFDSARRDLAYNFFFSFGHSTVLLLRAVDISFIYLYKYLLLHSHTIRIERSVCARPLSGL